MCQHDAAEEPRVSKPTQSSPPFPWTIPVYDAHCHPTDTMASIAQIPAMRASALTIMATRSQDQELVAEVTALHGVRSRKALADGHLFPSFGWHPWFSYQLYDDSLPEAEQTYRVEGGDTASAKRNHYQAVLAPTPEDPDFLASLPNPVPLSEYISATRKRLEDHPLALVGEIGLDKGFRLPQKWTDDLASTRDDSLTPGGREGRLLSPHHVKMPHQAAILKAQLALAGELGRAVSVHGVQAHGVLYDALSASWKGHEREVVARRKLKRVAPGAEDFSSDEEGDEDTTDEGRLNVQSKPYPPRICLHSFSAPPQVLKQYLNPAIPAKIFFSFSTAINLGTEAGRAKTVEVIQAAPDDRILVESDLHIAGDDMDAMLEEMYRKVCEIKGWELEDGVQRIGRNFLEYVFG